LSDEREKRIITIYRCLDRSSLFELESPSFRGNVTRHRRIECNCLIGNLFDAFIGISCDLIHSPITRFSHSSAAMHLNQRDYVEIEISKRIKIIDLEDSLRKWQSRKLQSAAACGNKIYVIVAKSIHRFSRYSVSLAVKHY